MIPMTKKTRKAPAKPKEGEYQPTEADRAVVQRLHDRAKARHPAPRLHAKSNNGNIDIKPDHPDHTVWQAALMETLGTVEAAFASLLINQLGNVTTNAEKADNSGHYNALLAAMHGIAPKDETEAMLAAQMVASHLAAMEMNRRAMRADYIDQMNSYGTLANKFMRTYALQTEALKRYRAKAQQTIRVERVYVNEGGQAIVGNVQGGGVTSNQEAQSRAKEIAHAPEPALRSPEQEREPLPARGDAER